MRSYVYDLNRVTRSGLREVWRGDFDDGNSGSWQQGYSQTNLDFSALRAGRANGFSAYTTSGCRRWLEPGDEKDLNPTYTKRVFRWSARRKTFVKIAQRSFHLQLGHDQRHPSKTLAHYDRAVALHPDDDDAYYQRGVVKAIKGDAHGAIADLNRAIRLDPTNALPYYFRGVAKKALGHARAAKADLARAAELGPMFTPSR